MNNWISVKDKMPDTYTEVIVYYPPENLYIQGYFEDITNSWYEIGGNKLDISPTHWMSLPEPPTEEVKLTLINNNMMLLIGGEYYRCSCGENVFYEYKTLDNKFIYRCHSCGTKYEGEPNK